jgi:quercetin dioxygenase-like cupin family protein
LDDHEELGPVITRAGTAGDAARFITGIPESEKPKPQLDGAPQPGTPQPGGAPQPDGAHQGLTFKALAADKNSRHMEPFIVDIEPNAEQSKSTHEGEEFIHVLSGNLALEYGSTSDTLHEGDSVYYDSIVPHRVFSADGKPVRILAVIYTPV